MRRFDGLSDIVDRRKNAEESERARVQHFFPVYKNLELTVATSDGLDVDILFAKCGRRTGGLNAGDSVAAPLNRY